MRIRKIDRKIERHILIGMIVNTNYLAYISTKIDKTDLRNNYASTVAGWCLDYFKKYGQAPGKTIQEIFDLHNRKEEVQEDEVDMIEKLLEDISNEYSNGERDINVDFLLDKTEEYLKRNRLQELLIYIENKLVEGDVKGAEDEILNMKPVTLTAKNGIDPLDDLARMRAAFNNISEPLLKLPGAIGELANEHLTRDSFVCFQAPEKIGKTFLMYYLCILGLQQGKKVAMFQVGDLTESQSIIRYSIILCGKSNKKKYCGKFTKPKRFISVPAGRSSKSNVCPEGYDIETEEINIEKPLTAEEAHKTYRRMCRKLNVKNNFRLFTQPTDTISFTDIDTELDRLEKQEDFLADIVLVDYMELVKCEERAESERAAVNKSWKKAKSINNKRHNLLISVTQSNAETYDGDVQTRKNYSEDKRKYSHVNAMFGISQTDEEKKEGVAKYNILVAREGEFVTSSVCYVLQNLRTGQPIIDSLFCSEPQQIHRRRSQNDQENNRQHRQEFTERRRPRRGRE